MTSPPFRGRSHLTSEISEVADMTKLFLIRHGETKWNVDGRFQGQQNSELNSEGCAQGQLVAQVMSRTPLSAIYTSDLDRAAETASMIAAPHLLTPLLDCRLREACFGAWEGYTLPEINLRWPEDITAWRADSLHTRPPGGETLEQVQTRVVALLDEIVDCHPNDDIAIVAHGGSLRAIIVHALGANLSIFRRLRIDNCSITTITVFQREYSLQYLNDLCHLKQQVPRATWDEAGGR